VGFENSRTSVNYNDAGYFAPLGGEFNPQVSLRLDYKFKQGFGPYIGASTSRSTILYGFTDIENGMNSYQATPGNMQIRMEAGYMYTSKPIFFNKSKQSSTTSTSKSKPQTKSSYGYYTYRSSSCSKNYSSQSSRCGSKSSSAKKADTKNKGGWVSLQPSVGVGFIPWTNENMVSKTDGTLSAYEYNAGNWNSAFLAGMGFEFGRNKQRILNVSVNYFSGIGNLNTETVTAVSGTKTQVANLQSKASGWNMRVGIPFTLGQKSAKPKTEPGATKSSTNKKSSSCYDKTRIEYKYRCRMQ
jgi:hypothetical protein